MSSANGKGRLYEMASTTATDYWNDSCSESELKYAIENGAVGATSNPVIVGNVFRQEKDYWTDYIKKLVQDRADFSEVDVLWHLNEEMAVRGANLLYDTFVKENGLKGRISIQTNPQNYRNTEKMTAQAVHFHSLAENLQVKIPVTKAGLKAIEEATYQGVNINATVSFSVRQAIEVAEAVERGLQRRERDGHDTGKMSPVCTLMAGRADDWLKAVCARDDLVVHPDYLEWAGVAIVKRAYSIYKEKGYRTRLLIAAYRGHYQWSEFIGGDLAMTIPHRWQMRFNNSTVEVKDRMKNPVDPVILNELSKTIPEFNQLYEPNGSTIEDFDTQGPTRTCLRDFLSGYFSLLTLIREIMVPDPTVK